MRMKLNITQRERWVLVAGAAAFVLLLCYLGIDGLVGSYNELGRKIDGRNQDLVKITHLRDQYVDTHRKVQEVRSRLDKKQKDFSVLSFIEDLANREGIRENIGSVKPKKVPFNDDYDESSVEIQMDNVTLPKLVNFAYKVENSGHLLKLKRLRVKTRYDNRNLLNVMLQVSTYERK
ncbi:MAG: type 4a pilus biogenesis protein PilO [bacterium]